MTINRIQLFLMAPALTLLLAAGCGGSSNDSSSSSTPAISDQLVSEAQAKSEKAADRVIRATPDKNLPTGHYYKSVCVQRGDPNAGDLPPNLVKCHVEAFYRGFRGRPPGYLWSEDWQVPVQSGKTGTAVILGAYRIRNYLLQDNTKNCSGRHRPRECLPQSVGGVLPG